MQLVEDTERQKNTANIFSLLCLYQTMLFSGSRWGSLGGLSTGFRDHLPTLPEAGGWWWWWCSGLWGMKQGPAGRQPGTAEDWWQMGEQEHRVLELVPLFLLSCSITYYIFCSTSQFLSCPQQYPCPFILSLSLSINLFFSTSCLIFLSLSVPSLVLLSFQWYGFLDYHSIIIFTVLTVPPHCPFFLPIIPLLSLLNTPLFSTALYHHCEFCVSLSSFVCPCHRFLLLIFHYNFLLMHVYSLSRSF